MSCSGRRTPGRCALRLEKPPHRVWGWATRQDEHHGIVKAGLGESGEPVAQFPEIRARR